MIENKNKFKTRTIAIIYMQQPAYLFVFAIAVGF